MNLGKFISERRKYLNMTQEELAEKLNVSKSAVAKWETNGGIPDRDNLKNVSLILNVSVDDLHHIIQGTRCDSEESDINITSEVIALLRSYGYEIIQPQYKKEGSDVNNKQI